jgi:hypothetical protein
MTIDLNNKGATALSAGNMSSAIYFFRRALKTSKLELDQGDATPLDFGVDRLLEEDIVLSSSNDNNNNNDFVIYDKPIRINESYADDDRFQQSKSILPSIVIFNQALANHLCAIETFKKHRKNRNYSVERLVEENEATNQIKEAVQFYRLAIRLQKQNQNVQQRSTTDNDDNSSSKIFFMSCLNNLCGAFRSLNDKTSERQTHQQLLSILMFITYNDQQQEQRGSSSQKRCSNEYQSFFLKNMFIKETDTTAPVA